MPRPLDSLLIPSFQSFIDDKTISFILLLHFERWRLVVFVYCARVHRDLHISCYEFLFVSLHWELAYGLGWFEYLARYESQVRNKLQIYLI